MRKKFYLPTLVALFMVLAPLSSSQGGEETQAAWYMTREKPSADLRGAPRAYGDPSPAEQAHLEAINFARLNPLAEAARLGIELLEGVAAGAISTAPVQPLAFNSLLYLAARNHSQDMVGQNFFGHDSPSGKTPGDRILEAGYNFRRAGENIAYAASTAPLDQFLTSLQLHDLLFIDKDYPGRGHRVNLLNPDFREVGIGLASGAFQGFPFAHVVTCDFGTTFHESEPFVLGVVFEDRNRDGRYSQGEGRGGVKITALETGRATTTATAGGYAFMLPPGHHTIRASLPDGREALRLVSLGDKNLKVDFLLSELTLAGPALPLIVANGVAVELTLASGSPVTLAVALSARDWKGTPADFWLVHFQGPQLLSFDLKTLDFADGLFPTYQGALFDFGAVPFYTQNLPPGDHTFCFAVDRVANAAPDLDQLAFACVLVRVTP